MIFVILGTQDKPFSRILKALEREIKKGNIQEKVVVQAGCTNFKSKYMEIYDYMDMKTFNQYIKDCDYVVTHGGVGSIIDSLKKNKKVLVVPRKKEYDEHENDHQIQIIEEFTKMGYILGCIEIKELKDKILEIPTFTPNNYKSNNKRIINNLEKYIDNL